MSDLPRFDASFPDVSKPAAGYRVLDGVKHRLVFHATKDIGMYSHHPQLGYHGGRFYASWSNHKSREDGPGQRVFAAISSDGFEWGKPFELFPSQSSTTPSNTQDARVLTALAWVPVDGRMYGVALVNGYGRLARSVLPTGKLGPIFWLDATPPEAVKGFDAYPPSSDSRFSAVSEIINKYLNEPLHLPNWGFHYGDEKLKQIGFHKRSADGSQMCEPTTYRRPDGVFVRLYRDEGPKDFLYSHCLYASLSRNGGKSWAKPVRTNIPDSPSRSSAGSLPDGRCYIVGNQVAAPFSKREHKHYARDPLVISVSEDGISFARAAAIRTGAPDLRARGRGKGRGYQYPATIIVGDSLWVLYSVGKEDTAISCVPLDRL